MVGESSVKPSPELGDIATNWSVSPEPTFEFVLTFNNFSGFVNNRWVSAACKSSKIESRSQNALVAPFDSRSSSRNFDKSVEVSSCNSGVPESPEVTPGTKF